MNEKEQHIELSYSEENYLKSIYKIGEEKNTNEAGTNDLANDLAISPASVNEMLKKLKNKKLVFYEKYEKTKLTELGYILAINIIRRHRLWETFLYEKLNFSWDEVHAIAEELEHIKSKNLIDRLDNFLGKPKYDPHGDPIPSKKGVIPKQSKKTLSEVSVGETCKMVAVKENSRIFLQYVLELGLAIDNQIKILQRNDFDGMTSIEVNGNLKVVSQKFSENIYVI